MNTRSISACLLSWQRPENMQLIVDSLRKEKCIDDITIWNNNPNIELSIKGDNIRIINSPTNVKTYGRFLAAQHAKHPMIYTQDDDYIIKGIPKLIQTFEKDPSCIAHGMTKNMYERRGEYEYGTAQMAFVGWGGIFRKDWLSVFDIYENTYGRDDLLQSKADRIFSILLHRKHNTIEMDVETLSGPAGPEALWIQPYFYAESKEAEQRALALIGLTERAEALTKSAEKKRNKFIILGSNNTGCENLAQILQEQKDVYCQTNIFNEGSTMQPYEIWGTPCTEPVRGAVIPLGSNESIENILLDDDDVMVFLLRRKNTLRQYIESLQKSEGSQKVTVDINAVKRFAESINRQYAKVCDRMQKKNAFYKEVMYEDLLGEKSQEIAQEVCDILGVTFVPKFQETIHKFTAKPLQDLIDNYSEVQEVFNKTPYEFMLT